eukprot:scaffold86948_cov33-Tisochrysis_lutea.AAC.4
MMGWPRIVARPVWAAMLLLARGLEPGHGQWWPRRTWAAGTSGTEAIASLNSSMEMQPEWSLSISTKTLRNSSILAGCRADDVEAFAERGVGAPISRPLRALGQPRVVEGVTRGCPGFRVLLQQHRDEVLGVARDDVPLWPIEREGRRTDQLHLSPTVGIMEGAPAREQEIGDDT